MNKELKRLLIVLGLYSLSGGIFYIFQELWMTENNLSIQTVSTVFSLCSILSISVIFLSSNLITKEKLKKFSCILFLLKTLVMICLFILNQTGLNILIKFLIMVDYVIDVELWISLYPLITLIKKSDKIYAIKDLIYDACYYTGVFLAGLLLGKSIGIFKINYNFYILIACLITFIAFTFLSKTNLDKYQKKEKDVDNNMLKLVMDKVKKDKVSINYLIYAFLGEASYNSIMGLMVLVLVDYLNFSAFAVSNYSIILGLGAALVGTIVIAKFTFKNNYINISLKYGIRLLLYILAFISNNKILILITFIFVELSSDSYIDVTDAPYINRYNSDLQLSFNNLKEMIEYLGEGIGLFLGGIALSIGLRYIFLVGIIFIALQILFAFKALKYRNEEC